ncbi:MAG TPA: hypothetical protein VL240_04145 [Candidatus Binatia bacterium]|nr:hypothetical protein [Candidatus Binatia bacterium]
MRLVSGIILGYLVFGLAAFALFRITGHNPHAAASVSFEISSIVYGILFALLAGYIAGFIGGRRDLLAAKVVGVMVALGAIASMMMTGIAWSQIAALLFMAPAVPIGGRWYLVRSRAKKPDH